MTDRQSKTTGRMDADRQTDRQTDRQAGRQAGRQIDRCNGAAGRGGLTFVAKYFEKRKTEKYFKELFKKSR